MTAHSSPSADPLVVAGVDYTSRLLVGTGKYKDMDETRLAVEASGAEVFLVVVSVPDHFTGNQTYGYSVHIQRYSADSDGDGDVDLDDHMYFADCMAGPDTPPSPTLPGVTAEDCLVAFDDDNDGDVDLANSALFQDAFTGG